VTLREHLGAAAPAYMIPSCWIQLPALPLLPNGKVDREALPAPGGRPPAGEHAGPRDERETEVCEIWRDVLRRNSIGIHDRFFEAGGDSIKAIQIVSRLRSALTFTGEDLQGYLFISPWLIGFIVFTAGPFLASFYLSFTSWDVVGPITWVGLQNYNQMFFKDATFWKSLFNTAYYVAFHVPGVVVIAMLLAVMLNQQLRAIAVYRTVFYLPAVTSGVATAIVWMYIFNGQNGLLNAGLRLVGIEGPNWLFSMTWSMPALIIMSLWNVGQPMIIYLAALQGVPQHLYEAVSIDGGGRWAKFRHVTMPMITPAIFFNLIMQIIGSFQVFTSAYVVTKGGPAEATMVYVLFLYKKAFQSLTMGYASGLAWILFLIILAFTLFQVYMSRRWVYYEGQTDGKL
jgi:multiple sugar transport system permease protein